jgi:hypothetical protein
MKLGSQFTTYDELWEVKEDEALTDLMDPRKRLHPPQKCLWFILLLQQRTLPG